MDPSSFYPVIHERDHDAFRRFPDLNLPDTYDKWRSLTEEIRRQRHLMAEKIVLVEIYPNEFEEFHRSRRIALNPASIANFAIEKGGWNFKRE